MRTNKERFEIYNTNSVEKNQHAVWRGLDGECFIMKVSILRFFKECNPFTGMNVKNTNEFYRKMTAVADQYVTWTKNELKECENDVLDRELKNFFIGYIGEQFFLSLLQQEKRLYIKAEKQIFTFDYVAPRIIDESDFGVDLTGQVTANDGIVKDCAIQVKFWNPFAKRNDAMMSNKLLQGVFADAVCNDIIDAKQDKNIFVCWLGDDSKVSKWARRNEPLYKHIVFIDRNVLKDNIDNKLPNFWNNFVLSLIK